MPIKDIMMVVDPGPEGAQLDEYTLSLAQTAGAHITAVGYATQIIAPVSFVGDYPYDLMIEAVEEARGAAQAAYARLEEAAPAGVNTEFTLLEGLSGEVQGAIGRAARNFDITVVRQSAPDDTEFSRQALVNVLFSSGRPAIVVPYIHKGPANLDRALVAWDGGMVAARALAGAMPLLTQSKVVEVVSVSNSSEDENDLPAFDVTRHLARHGINAEMKQITPGSDIASTLLSHASDIGANYMVMGCYGHSRMREMVLGGTSRTILDSMTIPLVMAH
ncbi:MAG: universal stress protein [Hyphomicrobiales bacterium]|nr:universal stress protein [Hyphomicrobiales bacterium]